MVGGASAKQFGLLKGKECRELNAHEECVHVRKRLGEKLHAISLENSVKFIKVQI